MYGHGGGAAVLHPASQQPIHFPSTSNDDGGNRDSTNNNEGGNETPYQPMPQHLRPGHRFKGHQQDRDRSHRPLHTMDQRERTEILNDLAGPGRRLRTNLGSNIRRHLDTVATILTHLDMRMWTRDQRDRPAQQYDALYGLYTLPVPSNMHQPVDCVLLKYVRSAINKVRCPIFCSCWSPEGKRLITGASTGEFTLWNGIMFNFETILQAHDVAIRALKWAHNDQWLVSADHAGFIKYWQPNMNNVHMYQAHKEAIRSLSFSPTDVKMATGSDDATARIWDFARCTEECILRGHGSDVRCVDWHPTKSLLATASRDSQQPVKLWDTRTGQCLATLHDHKNSVMACEWNRNGNWLLTGSRDHLIKLYDIRMMRETCTFRGHNKEVTSLAWHPIHEGLFASGGGDGSLYYWTVDSEAEMGCIEHAHDQSIWTLQWHPLGHVLSSGSNDNSTKFWSRSKPGDTLSDFHDATDKATAGAGTSSNAVALRDHREPSTPTSAGPTRGANTASGGLLSTPALPGMGLDAEMLAASEETLPGLDAGSEDANQHQHQQRMMNRPPVKRVQRQFERVWNVNKPMGVNNEQPNSNAEQSNQFQTQGQQPKYKQSLLGSAPLPGEHDGGPPAEPDHNHAPQGEGAPGPGGPGFMPPGGFNSPPRGPQPGMMPGNPNMPQPRGMPPRMGMPHNINPHMFPGPRGPMRMPNPHMRPQHPHPPQPQMPPQHFYQEQQQHQMEHQQQMELQQQQSGGGDMDYRHQPQRNQSGDVDLRQQQQPQFNSPQHQQQQPQQQPSPANQDEDLRSRDPRMRGRPGPSGGVTTDAGNFNNNNSNAPHPSPNPGNANLTPLAMQRKRPWDPHASAEPRPGVPMPRMPGGPRMMAPGPGAMGPRPGLPGQPPMQQPMFDGPPRRGRGRGRGRGRY